MRSLRFTLWTMSQRLARLLHHPGVRVGSWVLMLCASAATCVALAGQDAHFLLGMFVGAVEVVALALLYPQALHEKEASSHESEPD